MPWKETLPDNTLTDAERGELVVSVDGFIWKIAYQYAGGTGKRREQLADELHAVGLEGAFKAARHFQPARGFKFTTYAGWWIERYMTRWLWRERRQGFTLVGQATVRTTSQYETKDGTVSAAEMLADRYEGGLRWSQEQWEQLLRMLPEPRREIMRLYFLDGLTLEEIGKVVSRTRERIRQLISKSLERLRPHLALDYEAGD